jgi:catechol 2,3-dioxygenase-like lactoylglutathione lyase family enzyme
MVDGVAAVWVPVTDMKRAVAFYRDTLALEVSETEDDWSEVDANGLKIGLNAREQAEGGASGERSSRSSRRAASTTRWSG